MQHSIIAFILFLTSIIASNAQSTLKSTSNTILKPSICNEATKSILKMEQPASCKSIILTNNELLISEIKF